MNINGVLSLSRRPRSCLLLGLYISLIVLLSLGPVEILAQTTHTNDVWTEESLTVRATDLGWRLLPHIAQPLESAAVSLWTMTKGAEGAALVLVKSRDVQTSQSRLEQLNGDPTVAGAVSGTTLLLVVTADRRGAAAKILAQLLSSDQVPEAVDLADPAIPFSVVESDAPPEMFLGSLSRSEVLKVLIDGGWTLQGAPQITRGEGYLAVHYPLTRGRRGAADLTLYTCTSKRCIAMLHSLSRRDRSISLQRNQDNFVLVQSSTPGLGQLLQQTLRRASRRSGW